MVGAFGNRQPVGKEAGADSSPSVAANGSGATSLRDRLRLAAEVASAGLIGFGIMMWVAAHWDVISRSGRFAIVGGVLAVAVLVSLVNAVRTPGLIVSFLAAGGLLALIGQTYQTGADPWQLFAIWAAVGLPWAIAARSDALWVVWTVVVMLAITLWLATYVTLGWGSADMGVTLAAWLMALAVGAVFSPVSLVKPWLGETRWAFRMAAVLAGVLITQSGLAAILTNSGVSLIYWLSLLSLAGLAAALLALPILDIALIALLGLALDTLLISGIGRAVFTGNGHATGSFLFVGLAGAGIVAGTAALILKLARERAGGGTDLNVLQGREWPVILMTGIGALLSTIPLAFALGLMFGAFLTTGIGPYVIGAAILAGSVAVISTQRQTSFLHQLAAIGLTLGFCLIAFGLFRDAPRSLTLVSALLAVIATGLALAVGRSWTAGLLGAAAAVFAVACLNGVLVTGTTRLPIPEIMRPLGWTLLLAAGAAWYVVESLEVANRRATAASHFTAGLDLFVGGAMVAGLLGLMATSGPTFLLSGALGGVGVGRHAVVALQPQLSASGLLSAGLALAGCCVLLLPRPSYQTALGIGASLILVGLAAVIPSLGAPVLLLAAAIATSRRAMGVGAVITAIWVIGSFYYWLGWPLTDKAALLFAAGVALGVLCWTSGIRRPKVRLGGAVGAPPAIARALVIFGALATGGLAAQAITTNEAIIANGRQIFVALAPVDPRSLIQGDYMRLNFAVPGQQRRRDEGSLLGQRRWAIATVDDRQVATIERVVPELPASTTPGQLVLPLRYKDRRWIVGTDAWFFKEGTAKKWEQARFGVFRLGSNGTALLVGMADENLTLIQ
jgi:uncharacterized membrane-anchored protein/uncharacterized membrane protein